MNTKPILCLLAGLLALTCWPSASSQTQKAGTESAASQPRKVIARVWHGRTRTAKADEYYEYLKEAGIKKIQSIPGSLRPQVFRRTENGITEFTVSPARRTEALNRHGPGERFH